MSSIGGKRQYMQMQLVIKNSDINVLLFTAMQFYHLVSELKIALIRAWYVDRVGKIFVSSYEYRIFESLKCRRTFK